MFGCWDNLGAVQFLGPPIGQSVYNTSDAPIDSSDTIGPHGPVGIYGQPAYHSAEDLATCQAYVVKYRRVFGRDPEVWCVGYPGPVDVPAVKPPDFHPPPVFQPPVVREPPPSPPSTSNIYRHWGWRRRRPPVKRPYVEKPKPVAVPLVEICPIRGYTSRAIPGANEYQNFRCTPGQPVVIDEGLQRAGAADAYARHNMTSALGSLDDTQATFAGLAHEFLIGNIAIPAWLPVAALVVGGLFVLSRKK